MLRSIKNGEQYEEALEGIYALMQKDIRESSKATIFKKQPGYSSYSFLEF